MKTTDLTVTIIGCGWLGVPLGKALVDGKHIVHGSVRNESGFSALIDAGIQPFSLDLEKAIDIPIAIADATEVVIITLPPIDPKHPAKFEEMLHELLGQFRHNARILFTSSTGIYPKEAGEYSEDFLFSQEQDSSILNRAERVIRDSGRSHVILRLGGLIGPNRHPIRFLQGRKGVKNPHGPINFVHQGDCIQAMLQAIKNPAMTGTFNLVFPDYPSRKTYYERAAEHYRFSPPIFEESDAIVRVISASKIQDSLGFTFDFPIDTFPKLEIA